MNEEKVYYKRLDILRIISCLLVFLYHLNILPGGYLAVCVFFTLSGYLACMTALKNENFLIRKYYINRIKKIYLPLIIVIFSTIILAKIIPNIRWINLKPESMSAIFAYNNFWQLNANLYYFTRHVNSPFVHLWYISILLQFEILFPIAAVLFKKINEKITKNFSTLIVVLLTLSSLGLFIYMANTKDIMTVYYNTFARCFSVLFGVLLAIVHYKYNSKVIKTIKKYSGIPCILYTLIIIGLCIFTSADTNLYALFMILITLISIRLIEYSIVKKQNNKSTVLDFISKSSYEIYLVQYPVIFFINNTSFNEWIKLLLIVSLTIIISLLMHFLLNNKKNKIIKIFSILLFGAIIIAGTVFFILEEDHTKENKELEQKLTDNLEEIKSKNEQYQNDIEVEKAKWDQLLLDIESGENKIKEFVTNSPVVGIGDSVLLAASPGLYKKFPNGYFDGKVSRTIVGGRELLSELIEEGKVGDIVILALANNGDYYNSRNKAMMDVAGDREVFWINAVLADIPEFNEKFAEFAKDYPNLHIIDWEGYSKDHPDYFYKDGIHVKGDGVDAYAELVYNEIYEYYLQKYKESFKDKIDAYEQEISEKSKLLEENNAQIEAINSEIEKLKP